MTPIALICAGSAAALLLAGCGGSGDSGNRSTGAARPLAKAEYEAKVGQIVARVGAEYGTISTDPATISADQLEKAQRGLRELADRLERVNPPAEVKDLHAQYAAAMRSYADELPELTGKLHKETDPAKALDVILDSKSIQTLLRVSQEFSKKGYGLEVGGS